MDSSNLFYIAQVAYGVALLSIGFREIRRLRQVACASGVVFIFYGFMAAKEPLWLLIFWNTLFIAVHSFHLFFRSGVGGTVTLNPTATFLSKTALLNFPPNEVKSFFDIANEGDLPANHSMIQAGTELEYLFCILQGAVVVQKNGKKITELKAGSFVGEMSLLTRSATRADVLTLMPSKFLVWKHADINAWIEENPVRLSYLQSALGAQVVEELLRQNQEMLESVGGAA